MQLHTPAILALRRWRREGCWEVGLSFGYTDSLRPVWVSGYDPVGEEGKGQRGREGAQEGSGRKKGWECEKEREEAEKLRIIKTSNVFPEMGSQHEH